jgi:tetratricopeptide (TPR) repeat protein
VDVFLSSASQNFEDIRQDIYKLAEGRIWVPPKDLDPSKVPRFVIVDRLVEQIRKSNVFICVLRDGYGTSVFDNQESVSFLETEVYQSALYHKNVYFFLMQPFEPHPWLSGLLDVIRAIRPGIIPDRAQPKEAVLDSIKRVLDGNRRKRQKEWSMSLHKLVTQLAFARGHPKQDIEFFDKVFRPVSKRPDKDHINILLNEIGQETSIEKRLTRMWVALRELSAAPYIDNSFSEYLPYWDRALGAWASAAAWYDLHGHIYAGRLAAVNSMLRIREKMDWSAERSGPEHHIQGTLGGRASEYYSIAKLMPSKQEKERYLRLALFDVEKALKNISGDTSGYLAIQGHIYLQLGRAPDALKTFQEVHRLRKARGDNGGIGEALADLGLIHLKLGNLRQARSLLTEGTRLLEEAGNFTFAIRARKRLSFSLLTTGHPVEALKELRSVFDSAQEHKVYGQITPLMETINKLASALGACNHTED